MKISMQGKQLHAIKGSNSGSAVLQMVVRGKEFFPEVVKEFVTEGGNRTDVSQFVRVYDHKDYHFYGDSEIGCIIEMYQSQAKHFVPVVAAHPLPAWHTWKNCRLQNIVAIWTWQNQVYILEFWLKVRRSISRTMWDATAQKEGKLVF